MVLASHNYVHSSAFVCSRVCYLAGYILNFNCVH